MPENEKFSNIAIEYQCAGNGWMKRCDFFKKRRTTGYCIYSDGLRCSNGRAIWKALKDEYEEKRDLVREGKVDTLR